MTGSTERLGQEVETFALRALPQKRFSARSLEIVSVPDGKALLILERRNTATKNRRTTCINDTDARRSIQSGRYMRSLTFVTFVFIAIRVAHKGGGNK